MPARCASPTRDGEAIEIFERLHPAIVITDWVMPDLTGIELCHKIRADVHAAYTYIIISTSNAEKENVVKGLSAGADDYLTKPFHRDELLARVRVGERLIELQRQIEAKNRAETLRRNPEAQWKKVRHFRPYRRRRVSSNRNARGGIRCALGSRTDSGAIDVGKIRAKWHRGDCYGQLWCRGILWSESS